MVRTYKRKTVDRWSKEDLLEALTLMKKGQLKVNEASRQYGISRATLYRQYKKFILGGSQPNVDQFKVGGGCTILKVQEERALVNIVQDLEEGKGMKVSPSDIRRICYEYCAANGIPNMFSEERRMASDDWYRGFRKRHPNLKLAADMPKLTKQVRDKDEEGEGSVGGCSEDEDACPTLSPEASTSNASNMDSSSQSSVGALTGPLEITTSGEEGRPVNMTIRSEYDSDEEMGVWPNGETNKPGVKLDENMVTDVVAGEGTGADGEGVSGDQEDMDLETDETGDEDTDGEEGGEEEGDDTHTEGEEEEEEEENDSEEVVEEEEQEESEGDEDEKQDGQQK